MTFTLAPQHAHLPVLTEPLTIEQATELLGDASVLSVVVQIDVNDLLDATASAGDIDGTYDALMARAVTDAFASDATFDVIGFRTDDPNVLLVRLNTDFADFLRHRAL